MERVENFIWILIFEDDFPQFLEFEFFSLLKLTIREVLCITWAKMSLRFDFIHSLTCNTKYSLLYVSLDLLNKFCSWILYLLFSIFWSEFFLQFIFYSSIHSYSDCKAKKCRSKYCLILWPNGKKVHLPVLSFTWLEAYRQASQHFKLLFKLYEIELKVDWFYWPLFFYLWGFFVKI